MILLSKTAFIVLIFVICSAYFLVNGYVTLNIIRVYGLGLGKAFKGK